MYDKLTDPVRTSNMISPALQRTLWSLDPCQMEHHAGVLKLCKGMPVILKQNEATEIGATNGAEGTVVGWDAHVNSAGREVLDTLFVRLCSPPIEVQLDGLPPNVIPLSRVSKTVKCNLPVGNLAVSVDRSQICILGNFAMTDFGSQGKTKLRNVVHLKYCRNHQAMYTALSRSTSLVDTHILEGFNATKIRGGASFGLKCEFHELELLDDITSRREAGTLHPSIKGLTREELLRAHLHLHGRRYIPASVDPALKWDASLFSIYLSIASDKDEELRDTEHTEIHSKRVHPPEDWLPVSTAK